MDSSAKQESGSSPLAFFCLCMKNELGTANSSKRVVTGVPVPKAPMNRISGRHRWRLRNWFRYFGNRLRHLLRVLFQGQIRLGNNSYTSFFAIYNGNPPDLM